MIDGPGWLFKAFSIQKMYVSGYLKVPFTGRNCNDALLYPSKLDWFRRLSEAESSVSVQQLTQDRIYTRIITVQHLPVKPFPDAFPMSHPCLHNEPVAMVTVA